MSTDIPAPTVELLHRAQQGEGDALAALCRRYLPRVRGLVAVRMGESLIDMVDCDDIVQESMLAALARLSDFEPRGEGAFVCWLSRFVEGQIRAARRAAQSDKRGGGKVRRRADLGITTLSDRATSGTAPSPSAELLAHQLDDELERALLAIGDPYRQVVYCRLVMDMSHGEIATELELAGADSARALFHKGLERLRRNLEPRS